MSEPWRATAADYLQRQLDADDPQYADLLPPEPDILTTVREHLAQLPARPVAGWLEMGSLALSKLTRAARPPTPVDHGQIDALYGVPILKREDLPWDAWRLLDGDGNVIKEGTL